jgi:hypothetical protein
MFDLLMGSGDLENIVAPLAGVAWVVIPVLGILWLLMRALEEEKTKRHAREMLHRERMAAFEKGMSEQLERSITAQMASEVKQRDPGGLLTGGIITIGVGVALIAFFGVALSSDPDQTKAMSIGLIPIIIGVALLVAWAVTRRRKNANGGESGPRPT